MKNFTLFIVLIFNTLSLKSQTVHQKTYWTRLYVRVKLNDKWSWQTEAENRRFLGKNQALQFIAQTHIHRKLSNHAFARNVTTEGALGFTYSAVWKNGLVVPEWRIFQELSAFQHLSQQLRLSHRLRIEERWFHNASKTELTEGYYFKQRFRYRAQLDWQFSEKWVLKINDELMYNYNNFDQNQTYAGIEYKFRKDCSIELGYLKMLQKRSNNAGYLSRDNVRLTIFKDFIFQ